ncbi:MAG: sodium:calcium antiporter [Methylobacter sp.]|nr:sodium:calcium antiporter [Methylobacter sp.]
MLNVDENSLAVNLLIFTVTACAVWIAGTKIAVYADELAERFDLSHALLGLLLLSGITSLPEIATSFTAARGNNAPLAVNNMLGGIAMQVAVLAVADFFFGERALTSVVPDPVVMLQAAFNICLLAFLAMAIIVGDIPFLGAGAWSWGIFAASAYSFIKIGKAEERHPWVINNPDDTELGKEESSSGKKENERSLEGDSSVWLIAKIVISALVILFAGYTLATVGDVIARQSGLGESFVGFALMSAATSLPEASMVFASVRRGLYTMAISGILGTNPFNVALIFGIDIIAAGAPVLSNIGNFSAVGTLLGLAVTGLFLMGLAERADRTFLRMGVDSVMVLVVYTGGMVLLYSMRGG